ncbi:MAG: hypothetical protein KC492_33180 [Myxococcales bacterium]|nr:hypothetical protein [Myxococcales bacterium]
MPPRYAESPELLRSLRLRDNLLDKTFAEEVWPLASYARLFYPGRTDLMFRPVVGDQPFDAVLETAAGTLIKHIEVTLALDGAAGYQAHLRMQHIVTHGHVSFATMPLARNRATGEVSHSEAIMVSPDVERAEELDRIRTAALRKAAKRYPPHTALIVEYERQRVRDQAGYECVQDCCEALFAEIAGTFNELALVDGGGVFGSQHPGASHAA